MVAEGAFGRGGGVADHYWDEGWRVVGEVPGGCVRMYVEDVYGGCIEDRQGGGGIL